MTELTRPVKRKVRTVRDSALVVTLAPEGIWLREPRRRQGFLLPYGAAFTYAVRQYVDMQRAAKRKAKQTRNRR